MQAFSYTSYGFKLDFGTGEAGGDEVSAESLEAEIMAKAAKERKILRDLQKEGISFIENRGQIANEEVGFYADIFSGYAYVLDSGLTYDVAKREEREEGRVPADLRAGRELEDGDGPQRNPLVKKRQGFVFNESFVDPNPGSKAKGGKGSRVPVSVFGPDPSENKTAGFDTLFYDNLWEKIDLELEAKAGSIEKIFHVKPKGNPNDIRLRLEGPDGCYVAVDGSLIVEAPGNEISMTRPVAYQIAKNGSRESVAVEYEIHGKNEYGFKVGAYDEKRELIIDPLLAGTAFGNYNYMEVNAIAVDPAGNIYTTGYVYSPTFPTTVGAYDTTFESLSGYVSKFNSDMSALLASTLIGGNWVDIYDILIASSSGNVVIAGRTSGPAPTTAGAYDTSFNGASDNFISIFDSSLSTLLYSTFLGGSNNEYLYSVEEDASGNLFAVGTTYSANFPATPGAFKTVFGGGTLDAFVSKFNADLSSLLASTFFGGSSSDSGYAVGIDSAGNVFLYGEAYSASTTPGAYRETRCAGRDAYVAKFDNNLNSLLAATYLCGSGNEEPYELKVNAANNIVVFGSASAASSDFPTTAGAYDQSHNGYYDFYVSILDNSLSNLLASTFIGGTGDEWYAMGHDVYHNMAIDQGGSIFISNITDSCLTYPTTSGAFMEVPLSSEVGWYGCESFEPVISKFSPDLTTLESSTFYGGTEYSQGAALAVDASGNLIIGGTAYDGLNYQYDDVYPYHFPTSENAFSRNFYSDYAGWLAKLDNGLSAHTLDHFSVRTEAEIASESFDSGIFPPPDFSVGGDIPWEEFHSVQDADTFIDNSVIESRDEYNPSPSSVFVNSLTGYVFFIDSTGQSLAYRKSVDGGISWGNPVVIETVIAGWTNVAVWYDRWTPGDDTGTLVHIAAVDDATDDVYYTYLNTSNDSFASTTAALLGTVYTEVTNGVPSITKNGEGNLFISCNFSNYGGAAGGAVAKSADNGASWTPFNTGWSTVAADQVQLLPLLTGNDIIAIRADTLNNDIDYRVYDESADAWSGAWTSIAPLVDDPNYDQWFSASLRKSTGNIYLSFANYTANANNDIEFWTFSDGARAWSRQSDLFTDERSVLFPAPVVNDATGEIYVAYARGNLVYNTTNSGMYVFYKKSDDGGNTWGGESFRLNYISKEIRSLRTGLVADQRPFAVWYIHLDDIAGETLSTSTRRSAAKSGQISYGQRTYLQASYSFPEEGRIAFDWIADPGADGDAALFCADNPACSFYSADYALDERILYQASFEVAPGNHDFRWEYAKATTSAVLRGDEAWIDNVRVFYASSSKSVASGATTSITVKVYDDNGALWQSYYGEKSVTLSGASAAGGTPTCKDKNGAAVPFGTPMVLDFVKGKAGCDMLLYTPETASIEVTDGTVTSAALPVYDLDMTVTGGAPPVLSAANTSISVSSSTVASGQSAAITVTSYDTLGNPYLSGGETVVIAIAGANTASPAVTDNGDGSYSAAYTPANAGADTVTATINGSLAGSDTDGVSDGTFHVTVTAAPVAPANVPDNLSAIAAENSISLSWGDNSNPPDTEYYAENASLGTNSGWINGLNWNSAGLACGTSYDFRVKARNTDLVESAYSSITTISSASCPAPPSPTTAGGGISIFFRKPIEPPGGFKVIINKGNEFTDKRAVKLEFSVGEDTSQMAVSLSPDFSLASIENIVTEKEWDLCGKEVECQEGEKSVYVKFFNRYGFSSEPVSDSISYGQSSILIEINKDNGKTKYREIPIGLSGGSEEDSVLIADNPEFCGADKAPYAANVVYDLCQGKSECPAGKKKVYAKVANKWGISLGLASSEIEYEGTSPGLELLIDQGSRHSKKPLVKLDLVINGETDTLEFSNYYDFSESWKTKAPIADLDWNICYQQAGCPSGEKVIYVKGYNKQGKLTGNSSRSIRYENTEDGLEIVIEKGTRKVKTQRVLLSLKGGLQGKKVKLSASPDYCGAKEADLLPGNETPVEWDFCPDEEYCQSGEKEVYGEFYDENGNVIGESSDQIIFENPGESLDAVINNDDYAAGSADVTIDLVFFDGIESIAISEDQEGSDPHIIDADEIGGNEDAGGLIDAHVEWDLCQDQAGCGAGEKWVYVEFLDEEGNVIGEASDDIFYNGETDAFDISIDGGNEKTSDNIVAVDLDPSEEVDSIVVSDDGNFESGRILGPEAEISWDLCSGEEDCFSGIKTLYAEYFDAENKVIGRSRDSIYYYSPVFADLSEKILPADCNGMMPQIVEEADRVLHMSPEGLAKEAGRNRDRRLEKLNNDRYLKILKEGISKNGNDDRLDYFISYGTKSTIRHGEGERTGVLNSYKSAFGKLPQNGAEWIDVIRIANGCVPLERSVNSEEIAKTMFQTAYGRRADLSAENDQGAVDVISYGLRPAERDLDKERTGISIFRKIFAKIPILARAWDIVRSFAYSGAER